MAEQQSKERKELAFGPWEEVKVEGTPPSQRYGHASVVVGSRMYVWGGASTSEDGSTKWHNDMHVLHFGEVAKWELIDQKGDIPTPREGCTLNVINNELYLFGGIDKEGSFTCAEGLYVFQPESNTWVKRETTGTPPTAQSLSAVVYDQKLVTFGGVVKGKAQNSVHFLDTTTNEWTLVETTGTIPSPRCDHACVAVGEKMYVTGGSGSDELWFNDLYVLNLDSLQWVATETKGDVYKPRDCATITNIASWYLVLFGGFGGTGGADESYADLHFIDITSKSLAWTAVLVEAKPLPVSRFGHTTVLYQSKLYVFAGQNNDQELNDVWSVEVCVPTTGFNPTPIPRARYNTSTPIPAPRKTVLPTPTPPVKPRDFDELRSTYVKRINDMFDTLSEKFQQLDTATETLAAERVAFDAERKAHIELYERQQQELKEMLESHKEQNGVWVEKMRTENDQERRALAEERARIEKASAELANEQEAFQQKSKKLDAIMKQVQGLAT